MPTSDSAAESSTVVGTTASSDSGAPAEKRDPTEVASDDMRSSLAEVVNQVRYAKEKVVVTRHGKPMVAVVPLEDLEKIREAESLAAGRKALAEGDEGTPLADLTG